MAKQIKKVLSLVLLVVTIISSTNLEVLAAEIPAEDEEKVETLEAKVDYYHHVKSDSDISVIATRFGDTSITVGQCNEGMEIIIVTATDETASMIGVKDIKVKHKVWWGWDTVATSTGGCVYNSSGMSCTLVYKSAVVGDTYKISCVHYADVDGYREVTTETTDFIYNF